MDIYGLSSLPVGQFDTGALKKLTDSRVRTSSLLNVDVFVYVSIIFGVLTILKSYHDSIRTMFSVAPKLFYSLYTISTLAFCYFIMALSISMGDTDLMTTNWTVQLARWCLIIAAATFAVAPLFILAPFRKRPVDDIETGGDEEIGLLKFIRLTLLAVGTLFHLFISASLASILYFGPWTQMSLVGAACVGISHVMIVLFHVYCLLGLFYPLDPRRSSSIITKIKNGFSYKTVDKYGTPVERNTLMSTSYAELYKKLVLAVNFVVLGGEAYLVYADLFRMNFNNIYQNSPAYITVTIAVFAVLTQLLLTIFMYIHASSVRRKLALDKIREENMLTLSMKRSKRHKSSANNKPAVSPVDAGDPFIIQSAVVAESPVARKSASMVHKSAAAQQQHREIMNSHRSLHEELPHAIHESIKRRQEKTGSVVSSKKTGGEKSSFEPLDVVNVPGSKSISNNPGNRYSSISEKRAQKVKTAKKPMKNALRKSVLVKPGEGDEDIYSNEVAQEPAVAASAVPVTRAEAVIDIVRDNNQIVTADANSNGNRGTMRAGEPILLVDKQRNADPIRGSRSVDSIISRPVQITDAYPAAVVAVVAGEERPKSRNQSGQLNADGQAKLVRPSSAHLSTPAHNSARSSVSHVSEPVAQRHSSVPASANHINQRHQSASAADVLPPSSTQQQSSKNNRVLSLQPYDNVRSLPEMPRIQRVQSQQVLGVRVQSSPQRLSIHTGGDNSGKSRTMSGRIQPVNIVSPVPTAKQPQPEVFLLVPGGNIAGSHLSLAASEISLVPQTARQSIVPAVDEPASPESMLQSPTSEDAGRSQTAEQPDDNDNMPIKDQSEYFNTVDRTVPVDNLEAASLDDISINEK